MISGAKEYAATYNSSVDYTKTTNYLVYYLQLFTANISC